MKNLLTSIVVISSLSMVSCYKKTKNCFCHYDWDPNTTYYSGSLAKHNGNCWEANAQGGGSNVEPGTPGGEIWEWCSYD